MNPTTPPSLASKIAAWAEQSTEAGLSHHEACDALDVLRHDQPDFPRFLARKGLRLPEAHQQALLRLLQAAQATEFAPVLKDWSSSTALSLRTRLLAVATLESLGTTRDEPYWEALQQAEKLLHQLQTTELPAVIEADELQSPLREVVRHLPLTLILDVARDLRADRPHHALAVLQTLRPLAEAQDRLALVESLANLPLAESAVILQEMLAEASDKSLQKAIKKALHRFKAQGTSVGPAPPRGRAVLGTVTHRLETCLASHIDAMGDRALWMTRTKPFGGYNIAYVVINYGTGIKHAVGLQASKRELPDLLAKAQEHAPLIELESTYCQFQLAQAHQMNLDTGTPVPEAYFALRDTLGECHTTFEQAIIYSALSAADLQEAQTSTDYAKHLLQIAEFAGWRLPETIVQKYGDQLRDVEQSQIVVSPTIQRERINAIHAQAAEEVLRETSRRIMRLRLEEMAYYLLQTDRHRAALWAVAAAQSLATDRPDRLRTNPFISALLERSLEYAKRRPSSNIILPFAPSSGTEGGRRIIL